MDPLDYLKGEWQVISQTPVTFIIGGLIIFGAGYAVARHILAERLSTAEERVRRRDEVITELKKTLERKEEQVPPELETPRRLTHQQKEEIARGLRGYLNPEWHISVIPFQNEECVDFAAELVEAFRLAGVQSGQDTIWGGLDPRARNLTIRAYDDTDDALATRVESVLREVTGTPIHIMRLGRPSTGGGVFDLIVHRPG